MPRTEECLRRPLRWSSLGVRGSALALGAASYVLLLTCLLWIGFVLYPVEAAGGIDSNTGGVLYFAGLTAACLAYFLMFPRLMAGWFTSLGFRCTGWDFLPGFLLVLVSNLFISFSVPTEMQAGGGGFDAFTFSAMAFGLLAMAGFALQMIFMTSSGPRK